MQNEVSPIQEKSKSSVKLTISAIAYVGVLLVGPVATMAQEAHSEFEQSKETVTKRLDVKEFSPYAGRAHPTQVFWGDQRQILG
jgi:hypothetical protein